jgi:hypothetical protein
MLIIHPTNKSLRVAIVITTAYIIVCVILGLMTPAEINDKAVWYLSITSIVSLAYTFYIYTLLYYLFKELLGITSFKFFFILNLFGLFILVVTTLSNNTMGIGFAGILLLIGYIALSIKFILLYKIWKVFPIAGFLGIMSILLSVGLEYLGFKFLSRISSTLGDIGTILILLKAISELKNPKNWIVDLME